MAANNETKTWPQLNLEMQVVSVEPLVAEVYKVILRRPVEIETFGFHAGQYLELVVDENLKVPYSIASSPHQDELELHVMHQGAGTLSDRVIQMFRQQSTVRVRLAMGECMLLPTELAADESVLLLAAGTCFGQMKAMIEHALAAGLNQPIHLYWGVRQSEQLYLRELAESWAATHPQVHFVPVVSEPEEGWSGRTGFVHKAVLEDFSSLDKFQVFVCGPPQMVYAAEDDFIAKGMRPGAIHSDVFAYAPRPQKKD